LTCHKECKETRLTVREPKKSVYKEYIEAIAIAILLALFIRTFIVQAFKIPSGSMLPTLQIGDHLLVNKLRYGLKNPFTGKVILPLGNPKSGDVVVFRFPQDRDVDYIKRVVGISGDTIVIKNKKVFVNDQAAEETHAHFSSNTIVPGHAGPRDNFGPVKVPEGKIFVMGDNRDNSYDSRFWGFVDQRDVLGKAFVIYWSWDLEVPLFSLKRFTSVRWNRFGNIIH
jgi:signal peptidase I